MASPDPDVSLALEAADALPPAAAKALRAWALTHMGQALATIHRFQEGGDEQQGLADFEGLLAPGPAGSAPFQETLLRRAVDACAARWHKDADSLWALFECVRAEVAREREARHAAMLAEARAAVERMTPALRWACAAYDDVLRGMADSVHDLLVERLFDMGKSDEEASNFLAIFFPRGKDDFLHSAGDAGLYEARVQDELWRLDRVATTLDGVFWRLRSQAGPVEPLKQVDASTSEMPAPAKRHKPSTE